MTVRIYIWKPRLGIAEFAAIFCQDVGHVSMSIDDRVYFSHRPRNDDRGLALQRIEYLSQQNIDSNRDLSKKYIIKNAVLPDESSKNFNYQKDVERFRKREADIMYEICGLDEYKMARHWYSNKYLYHPLYSNCSGVVAKTFLASFCNHEKYKSEQEILSLIKSNCSNSSNPIIIYNIFRSNLPFIVKCIFAASLGIWTSYKMANNIILSNRENVLWTPDRIPRLLDSLKEKRLLKDLTIRRCSGYTLNGHNLSIAKRLKA